MRQWIDLVENNTQRVNNQYFSGEVEVLTNPSRVSFMKMLKEHGGARGFLDVERGQVHVWFAAALHGDIEMSGSVWLTWNEPSAGDLKMEYDGEWFFDAFEEENEDADPLTEFMRVRPFARLAQGFNPVVNSR